MQDPELKQIVYDEKWFLLGCVAIVAVVNIVLLLAFY